MLLNFSQRLQATLVLSNFKIVALPTIPGKSPLCVPAKLKLAGKPSPGNDANAANRSGLIFARSGAVGVGTVAGKLAFCVVGGVDSGAAANGAAETGGLNQIFLKCKESNYLD